jgi:hypothetical protein
MKTSQRHILGISAVALLAGHCGGSVSRTGAKNAGDSDAADSGFSTDPDSTAPSSDDGGFSLDDSGMCEGTARHDGAPGVPSEHRAAAAGCTASPAFVPPPGDAGPVSIPCSSDADCSPDGSFSSTPFCLDGSCNHDQCLVDSECPTGQLCLCGTNAGGGWTSHANRCVPANCRVDADCGPNEYCSPSRGYCGGVSGYYCHTSADTCVDDVTDCACGGNACVYEPTVGHFLCGTSVCMG